MVKFGLPVNQNFFEHGKKKTKTNPEALLTVIVLSNKAFRF